MVTDFGIAKALSSTSGATLTGAGVAIGTPAFMSPEQAAGEREIDGRSDVYSLGVVAFQMLTGELPFTAPTVAGILMKQITEPAPDIRTAPARRAGGSGAGGEPVPREGPGEPVAQRRRPSPLAREPHGRPATGRPAPRSRGSASTPPRRPARSTGGASRARRRAPAAGGALGRPARARAAAAAGAPGASAAAPAATTASGGPTRTRCRIPASRGSSRRRGVSSRAGRPSPSAASGSTSPPGSATPGSCSRCSAWASACSGTTPSSGRRATAGGTC